MIAPRRAFLSILFPALGAGATRISLTQAKANTAGVAIVTADGTLDSAVVGAGLVLTPKTSSSPSFLQVQNPLQSQPVQVWNAPIRKTGNAYFLVSAPISPITSMRVHRNGLRQSLVDDYTLDALFTVLPVLPWGDDDTVVVDYSR